MKAVPAENGDQKDSTYEYKQDQKDSIWPFFFSNQDIPETDRIPMKCKDLYRLK